MARLVYARNRFASGRGNDPMAQVIHDEVCVAHLEIVASHELPDGLAERLTLNSLTRLYPPPMVE